MILHLPPTDELLRRRRVIVTGLFFVLACAYAALTPIFEISDEAHHYPVVDYIATQGKLPVQDINRPNPWDWEAAQPPLYYALGALMIAPFDRSDLPQHLEPNPHTKIGIGLASDNQNYRLHDWDAQKFPWRGTPLHVRLLRFWSVLLGTFTVWLTFTIARLSFPDAPQVALLAQMLTAFNPMFLAITGSVNNDNLVIMLSTLCFAVILSLWRAGFSWQRVVVLGFLGTLACASKVSGSIIFVPAGLVILLVVWRDGLPWRYVLFAALIFFGIWGSLFGWWYLRNLDLYRDFFGSYHMAQTVGLREKSITLDKLIFEEWFSFYAAYWGWFGAVNILAPLNLFYYTGLLIFLAGFAWFWSGFFWLIQWLIGRGRRLGFMVPLGLMALTLALASASLLQWTMTTPASQGRLLFPFMYTLTIPCAYGLWRLLGKKWAGYSLAPLMLYAGLCIGIVIPYAFRLPPVLDALPEGAQVVDVRYGEIQLLGYEVDNRPLGAGDELKITLYWRALAQTPQPLSFYLQVFAPTDGEAVQIGKVDSYPGRGLLRTDTWETGLIYEDSYGLTLRANQRINIPFEPRIKVGWRDAATESEIIAMDAADQVIDSVILRGGRWGTNTGWVDSNLAEFGGLIRLKSASAAPSQDQILVSVYWQALTPISEDFTVFVQLIDPANPTQALAFGDSVPRDGWWRTSLWIEGHTFYDSYRIQLDEDLPAGDYEILLGFYRPQDFTRLPVNVRPYPDAYRIALD